MSGGQAVPAADSKPVFATSVRNMVEFLLKSGSIETGGATSVLDMSIGAAIHRKLQRQAKDELEDYRSEVRLACDCDCGDLVLTVRGSADGVARRADGVTIEEIKSISVEAALVKESDRRLHWAQAMCYGYMLCLAEPLEQVTLELVYYEVKTDRITRQQRVLTKQELYDFFNDLVERYAVWMRWKMRHQADRAATAAALAFPFGQFRRGQRTVAGEVYRAVRDGQCLFVSAPTGIGKTMATLYPAVKAQGEGIGDKVFYLTAKTMTRQAAASALALLEQGGLEYRAVTLTAKDKLCPYERRCNPVDCPYADGYYDKINDAVFGLLHTGTLFSPQDIREAAERYAVCPFELSLDLSVWCDCVIGDYNHLFDPIVHLQRFFGEDRTDHVVLVDEAHNLVDRGREMFSSTLCKKQWDEAGKAIKTGRCV